MRMHYKLLLLSLFIVFIISAMEFVLGGVSPLIALSLSFMNMIGAAYLPYKNFVLPTNPFILVGQLVGIVGYIVITIILTTFFYRLLRNVDIKASIAKRKATAFSNHVVLNPVNSFSLELAKNLKQRNIRFIMTDKSKRTVDYAIDSGYVAVEADMAKEDTQKYAFLDDARILVLLGDDDIENVLITIETKRANPHITILARIKRRGDMDRVLNSGVSYAIMPETAVGDEMGEFLIKLV